MKKVTAEALRKKTYRRSYEKAFKERECSTCKFYDRIVNSYPCKNCYMTDGLPNWIVN